MRTIGTVIYLVVGVLVASAQNYLGDIGSIAGLLNLFLAILLWPLVLLGVDFNLKFGGGGGRNRALLWGPVGAATSARTWLTEQRKRAS